MAEENKVPEGAVPFNPKDLGKGATQGPEKIDWVERVSKSNGTSFFIPERLRPLFDKFEKVRQDYNKDVIAMAEKQLLMNHLRDQAFFELRKYLSQNGTPDIWIKELGLDELGAKENAYVVNIWEAGK